MLAELADQEESRGRTRPTFRTAVPYVESNDREARTQPHRQQEVLTDQERLPLGTSGTTARDWWEMLASDREISEEEVRLREIGERFRAQASSPHIHASSLHTHLRGMRERREGREMNERLRATGTWLVRSR